MNQYIKDGKLGLKSEISVHKKLEEHYNIKLEFTDNHNVFDYFNEDNKILIELKTRRNKKYTYPTTIIGNNKIIESLKKSKEGYDIYFYFAFTDKLCFIKYDETIFKSFKIAKGGRNDRGIEEYNQYIYIPINELTNI